MAPTEKAAPPGGGGTTAMGQYRNPSSEQKCVRDPSLSHGGTVPHCSMSWAQVTQPAPL
jgi:hypothetical protein